MRHSFTARPHTARPHSGQAHWFASMRCLQPEHARGAPHSGQCWSSGWSARVDQHAVHTSNPCVRPTRRTRARSLATKHHENIAVPAQTKIAMASGTGTGAHRSRARVTTRAAMPPRVNTSQAHRGMQLRWLSRMGDFEIRCCTGCLSALAHPPHRAVRRASYAAAEFSIRLRT